MTFCLSRSLLSWLAAAALALGTTGCDLTPKTTPCSNAGECEAVNPRFRYCVQSHCVECLEDSGCGDGNLCKAGMCERRCKTARDCPTGDACTDGLCQQNP